MRRILFAFGAGCGPAVVAAVLVRTLAVGGWNPAKVAILACFAATAPWLALCFGNGVVGFVRRLRGSAPVAPVMGPHEPVALVVTVRDEDIDLVLREMAALLDGLRAAGAADWFTAWVLSDSRDPAGEAAACAASAWAGRVRYRHRPRNVGFKAGNVMDFLDRHAATWPLAIMLDADSRMSAAAVLRLVGFMQERPDVAIVQHLTVGLPAETAFARLFQFGMRAGMRSWASGQDWWQGDEGPYWGHNAIIRTAPFRDHARLPGLPGGGSILSHDQVEAALLARAGWGIRVLAEEDGSFERNPPTLPDFIVRDRRWLAGNLQYIPLLRRLTLRPVGRWQLLQAILLFAGAPLHAAMFGLAVVNVAIGGGGGAVWPLAVLWAGMLYAPKLLGYAEVALSAADRARYGGGARLAAGAAAEIVFTLLLDAPMTLTKAAGVCQVVVGRTSSWTRQNRAARGVGWGEATALFWPHTVAGILAFAILLRQSWGAALVALPFAGGLLVAIPLCVLSADATVSGWLRRHGIAATPEEISPPPAAASPSPG